MILNWNGFEDTRECIESLEVVKKDNFEIKIVLVDNASANDEGKRLKDLFPGVVLIQNEKNEGFAEGNNVAIRYCFERPDCDYIMLLNNDTVATEDFLVKLIRFLRKNPRSVVAPKLLYADRRDIVQTLGGKIFLGGTINCGEGRRSQDFRGIFSPDFLSGACYIASKEVFLDVGVFDPKYFAYLEDLDWCLEAKKRRYGLFVDADSVVYHKHSKSTRGSFLKVYLIVRNNLYFARKQFGFFKCWIYIFNHLCIGLGLNIFKYRSIKFLPHFFRGIKDGLKGW